jgi:hypothetical protein
MSPLPRVTPTRRPQVTRARTTRSWASFPTHQLPQVRELPDGMKEADFTTVVLNLARHYGWCAVHFRPGMRQSGGYSTPVQGMKGSPDLILARNGVVIHAELKTNRGSLRPEQRQWRDHLGDHYRLWRPRDWQNIIAELRPATD